MKHIRWILMVGVILHVTGFSTAAINPNAHWKLDGDATDSSGNGHDGTVHGDPNWIFEGVDGGAIQLNGIDQYLSAPNDLQLKPELPFTISAWINLDALETGGVIIQTDSWGGSHNYSGASIQSSNSDTIAMGYGDNAGTGPSHRRTKVGTTVLQPATWYHVVGVFRGPEDMSIYIDGVDDGGSYSGTGGELGYSTGDLTIGSRNGEAKFFQGAIDDVRIYDRGFLPEQVIQLYNLTEPLPVELTVGPGESIQAAIVAAGDGDTVMVMPGTYVENLNLLGKAITLTSTEPNNPAVVEATVIDGNQDGSVITCDSREGPDTLITGLTFTNGAALQGGGMYNYESSPTVTHCIFTGNTILHDGKGGAGMYNGGGSPTVSHCTFKDNNGEGVGGGMHNNRSGPTVTCCIFTNNFASGSGGGMYNWMSRPTLSYCIFTNNRAFGHGGGMYNGICEEVTVTDCIFSGNSADDSYYNFSEFYGGGMANHSSNATIIRCVFSGNSAPNAGGGMDNRNAFGWPYRDITVKDCIFSDNVAVPSSRGYSRHGHGGGIASGHCDLEVTGCVFIGNKSMGAGGGLSNVYKGSITNCAFIGNTLVAEFNDGRPVEHGGYGGGVAIWDYGVTVVNCIFTGNTAKRGYRTESYGGGLYDARNATTFSGCTFSGNMAGYGGAAYGGSIANSILWGNTATVEGPEVHEVRSVDFCNVQGGYAGDGNIDLDPLFADADGEDNIIGTADDDLRLTTASPCIDTGSNDLIGRDWADLDGDGITGGEKVPYDLDGNRRIENDVVDMGAYEFAPVMQVDVDIKPQSCPNPVNSNSKGVVPVAILGTEIFDVNTIDPNTLLLEGVAAVRYAYEDVAAPAADEADCACSADGPDGFMDMTLNFDTQQLAAAMGEVEDGQEWLLHLAGQLNDGTTIEGTDCVLIIQKGK